MSSRPFTPATFGKYVLTEKIASGGMAEVFRAVMKGAAGFEKTVALKRILPFFSDEPSFLTLFQDEARIVSTLSHANIAHVFEFGEVDGSYYLTMELVDGIDLAKLGDKMRAAGQPMPLATASFVVAEAARGLAYAHEKKGPDGQTLGIVHRDVSPQNILISYEGEVKVTDFGIAKAAGKSHKTATGVVMGKLKYMSPEQVSGKAIDPRSDIFSLGVILYELVTGGPVFPGEETVRLAELIHTADIPPPSTRTAGIPEALDAIVLKALSRTTEERYGRAADLARDLSVFVNQHSPGFTREDLAALVRHIAPPPVKSGPVPAWADTSQPGAALAPTQVTPPEAATANHRRRSEPSLVEIPPTKPTEPPPPAPGDPRSGSGPGSRPDPLRSPRQLDVATRTRFDDEGEPPAPKKRKRLSKEAWIGIVLFGVTLAAGAMIVLRFVIPPGDAAVAESDASVLAPGEDAAAVVEATADAGAVAGISEERQQEIRRKLSGISALKQPRSPDYLDFMNAVDWDFARLTVDDQGAIAHGKDALPGALAERVQARGLAEAIAMASEYVAGTGQLPSPLDMTFDRFASSSFSKGGDGWSTAGLVFGVKGPDEGRLTNLARANQALGRWCAPAAPPRPHRDPRLCEPAALAAALRDGGEGALADALDRWQKALPNDKKIEIAGGSVKITSMSYSPVIINLDTTVPVEGKLLSAEKPLVMRREDGNADAGASGSRLTVDNAPEELFAPVLELRVGNDVKLVRL